MRSDRGRLHTRSIFGTAVPAAQQRGNAACLLARRYNIAIMMDTEGSEAHLKGSDPLTVEVRRPPWVAGSGLDPEGVRARCRPQCPTGACELCTPQLRPAHLRGSLLVG